MYMSTGKLTTLAAAAALLVPAGLTAQGHAGHHPGDDAPPARHGMMDGRMTGQQSGMHAMMPAAGMEGTMQVMDHARMMQMMRKMHARMHDRECPMTPTPEEGEER